MAIKIAGDSKTGSPQEPLRSALAELIDIDCSSSSALKFAAMFAINATTLYAKAVDEENATKVSIFARPLKRIALTPDVKMGAPTNT